MLSRIFLGLVLAAMLGGCVSAPKPRVSVLPAPPANIGGITLPDRAAFSQKDPRWANHPMGGSGKSMEAEGCLVTASAMALSNLGVDIDPGELNQSLKVNGGYTSTGQLIWAGIETASTGRAIARYYDDVSMSIIDTCMTDGFYPMVRFKLPNGRTHWAMIVRRDKFGFHMRDPLHISKSPLLYPGSVETFEAIRCVGPK